MNCQICGKGNAKTHVLKGPGKNDEIVYLCSTHKNGLKRWQRKGGR